MKKQLACVAIFTLSVLAGCASNGRFAQGPDRNAQILADLTTAELQSRRSAATNHIAEIEREVEMKAGLHMGVFISDDRGRLAELYKEVNSIDRELLRRSAYSKF